MESPVLPNISMNEQIRAAVSRSISNYTRMGIDIDILQQERRVLKVKIEQKRLLNGYILNQKQLIERAREVFEPTGLTVHIFPAVFSLDVNVVSIDWIKQKMLDFGIKRKDIIKQLAVDKCSLSLYLSGDRKMNKLVKAAFFFYFLSYELNTDFRAQQERVAAY